MSDLDDALAQVSQGDLSHGLLVAVLMASGGSVELTPDQLQPDAMGGTSGELYDVELVPDAARDVIRLQVVPRAVDRDR